MGKVIIQALISVVSWFVGGIALKAVVVGALYWVLTYFMPLVWGYVAPFLGVSSLTSFFSGIPDGVYWAIYATKGDVGIPLVISAYLSRFLVRRLHI